MAYFWMSITHPLINTLKVYKLLVIGAKKATLRFWTFWLFSEIVEFVIVTLYIWRSFVEETIIAKLWSSSTVV